ncbi:MAG TPA: hypothetical protein VHM91_00750 [Verrucomicrobiales bacterium]|jgi:hypothetical protein|nr:hypothetical protein [Verrucomicrobiales bacterium]
MKFLLTISLSFLTGLCARAGGTLVLVTGAAGEAGFGEEFSKQTALWNEAGKKAGVRVVEIGTAPERKIPSDLETLRTTLAAEPPDGTDPLWIVFNGHGTWDGKTARFNLRGPDISAADLATWLKPLHRPLVVINSASSSAPFIAGLSGPGRTIITSTRSGSEQNYARFGGYLAAALTDPAADLDTDGDISLLEAFLAAARRTAEFYKTEGRLATEHALIDDNGDGLGTPADWFKGLRAVKTSDKGAAPDGAAARHLFLIPPASEKAWPPDLLKQRENLESRLAALREIKATLKEDDYFSKIEPLLLDLARLTQKAAAGP